jgi:hypothetical protein
MSDISERNTSDGVISVDIGESCGVKEKYSEVLDRPGRVW